MDDLLARFAELFDAYQTAKRMADRADDPNEMLATEDAERIAALELCNFLIEHAATVTFDASARGTEPPSVQGVETDYEWVEKPLQKNGKHGDWERIDRNKTQD